MHAAQAAALFVAALKAKMDYPCPATQDAIDRVCLGLRCQTTGNTGRGAVDNFARAPAFLFNEIQYFAAADVLLSTGTAKDTWYERLNTRRTE